MPTFDAVGAERQPHRIGGIVRDGERSDGNVADFETVAGGKNFEPRQLRQFAGIVAQRPGPGLVGGAGHEYRHLEFSGQHGQPVNVVGVFVSNQDGGKGSRIVALGAHAFDGLAAGNSRIHENLRARTGNDGAVSPAAAGQHRNRNSHVRRILAQAVETRVTNGMRRTVSSASQLSAVSSQLLCHPERSRTIRLRHRRSAESKDPRQLD